MKRALLLFLIPLLFSCNRPSGENWEGLEVNIDTVFVEAGEDLIFLQTGLSHSDLSNDQRRLFNFTPKDQLEVFDLDSLKLLHKISMEKEGPLGTGMPYAIQFDQTGRLVLFGYNEVRFFSPDLSYMKHFRLNPETLSGLEPQDVMTFNTKLSSDGKFLFSIYENTDQIPQGLAAISFEEMRVEKIPFDLASRIQPFVYSLFMEGRLRSRGHEGIYLEIVDNWLIVSTPYANEAFILDLETDEVRVKAFHSELTQDRRPIPIKTSAETINEFSALIKEGEKSVKFGGFQFDETLKRFWRFSRDIDREIGDSLVFRNVLTVFDKDLNQLAETVVEVEPFSKKFFKDGKLWSYVNVNDELGFAVIDLGF